MTNNFTHLNSRFDIAGLKTRDSQLRGDEQNGQSGPSESVINNLLNYSRALSVMSDRLSGKVHLILLN